MSSPILSGSVGLTNTGGSVFGLLFAETAIIEQLPVASSQRQWNFVDTLSLSKGRHQLKFGLDYRRLTPFSTPFNPTFSYYYFDEPSVAANNAVTFAENDGRAFPLYHNFSAFAQDEWRASGRLTLSMGLRWEVNPAPAVGGGRHPNTTQGASPDLWQLAPQGTPEYPTTWFNFAPRIGAAYMLRGRQGWETVLRGGFGVFFDTGQQMSTVGFSGPGFFAFNVSGGPYPKPVPQLGLDPSAYCCVGTAFASHLQLPYTLQWNGSIEQSLGGSQALTLTYVGSHASRLLQSEDVKTPTNTTFPEWTLIHNRGSSDYDALQLQFRRRLTRGLTGLGSYTWSHCLDFGSMNFESGFERGNCDFDVRHNFEGAFSYDLPNLGQNGIADALLHHWGVDTRFIARSGFPLDLTGTQLFNPITGARESNGVDFIQGVPLYVTQCVSPLLSGPPQVPCPGGRGLNPKAFEPVTSGFGDVPRNFFRGFGAWQMNLAVRREFSIHERLKLQFRAEAFNVFNHPNFGNINGACGGTPGVPGCTNTQFGQATATLAQSLGSILSPLYQMGGPRSMQFALKLVF